jgi:DNA-directed RNA polymerase subunit M/transcription elongation factor TFIIS
LHSEPPIEFYCAICGQALTANAEFAGNVINCPTCERNVPVPGCFAWSDVNPKCQPAFSPEILSVEITFVCPGCNYALVADARWGGEPFICPKCDTTGDVPDWARAKVRTPVADAPRVHTLTLSPEEIDFLSGGTITAV